MSWLGYSKVQKSHGLPAIVRQSTLSSCINCEDIKSLFEHAHQNIAITPDSHLTAQQSDCTPLFNTMTNLKNADSVFKDSTFTDYSNANLDPNHIGIQTWEPFEGLKKLEIITYLYNNNNIPKLFKVDFGIETGFKSIGGLWEFCNFNFKIPYNYFDTMKKLSQVEDDDYYFMMNHLLRTDKITSIVDTEHGNKILMSEWNPEVPSNININARSIFLDRENGKPNQIPSDERLKFLNGLCIIKNKTYNKLLMDSVTPFKANQDGSPVDVTPFLIDGKILNITANINELDIHDMNYHVKLINIPAQSIVIPDSVTKLNITNMFEGCIAHPDVTDLSQVFVYNGPLSVDWSLSGLKLLKKEYKVKMEYINRNMSPFKLGSVVLKRYEVSPDGTETQIPFGDLTDGTLIMGDSHNYIIYRSDNLSSNAMDYAVEFAMMDYAPSGEYDFRVTLADGITVEGTMICTGLKQ